MNLPNTLWLAWCHTCNMWLDEDSTKDGAVKVARSEHDGCVNGGHHVQVHAFNRATGRAPGKVSPKRSTGEK